jgi:hypothetical protein
MQDQFYSRAIPARPSLYHPHLTQTPPRLTAPRPASAFRTPTTGLLTREQLRAIVIEQLG